MKALCMAIATMVISVLSLTGSQAQTNSLSNAAVAQGTLISKDPIEYKGNPGSPFSEVVRVGTMLYLSGQLGVVSSGGLAPGGVKAETKQALDNIRAVLERNNSGMDRVVKCTVMLLDIADRPAMSEIYVSYFPKDRLPARSTFGVTGLALGARIEIECMATVK